MSGNKNFILQKNQIVRMRMSAWACGLRVQRQVPVQISCQLVLHTYLSHGRYVIDALLHVCVRVHVHLRGSCVCDVHLASSASCPLFRSNSDCPSTIHSSHHFCYRYCCYCFVLLASSPARVKTIDVPQFSRRHACS